MSERAAGPPALEVRDLSVAVKSGGGERLVVEGLSFQVGARETLCIAGESGSGKSMSALAVMGLLPRPAARVVGGSALLGGRDLLKLGEREIEDLRGNEIAMIFQEPMTSLNPVMSIGSQLTEVLRIHEGLGEREARARSLAMLEAVRISEPQRRLRQYPHELSGGMRQRVMIAMALLCRPKVLIADEPTTALDVTIQAQILSLMRELQREFATGLVLITHDMGVVAQMADRVVVMNGGRLVEEGEVTALFRTPREDYTRRLLAAVPRLGAARAAPAVSSEESGEPRRPLVSVRDLTVRFDIRGGLLQRPVKRVHAVERVSFDLYPGETLALVGESGCGKSTTGKALLNLVEWKGRIRIGDAEIAGLSGGAMKAVRRRIQMIFQDPFASLDPRMTVGELVAEPLVIHGLADKAEREAQVAELFRRVGLPPEARSRYPHEFSGGQRQRICIARALSLGPDVIVADECVSALDVSVQAQVLELLRELQQELSLSYLFISHDMAVVDSMSHRVAVMYLGEIVEIGPCRAVLGSPAHPYTRALLDSVPIPDPVERRQRPPLLSGEVPSPIRALDYRPQPLGFKDLGGGHLVADNAARWLAAEPAAA